MTAQKILQIAMEQSAEDINCRAEDFMKDQNVLVPFRLGKKARSYLKEPITAAFVSYGNNVVASAAQDVADLAAAYLNAFEFYHLFETPNMYWLGDRLAGRGYKICFMAEYYLPDPDRIQPRFCGYPQRILEQRDFEDLYLPQWGNALCRERKHLDLLGVGAYEDGELIGLAACSADCEGMWQIGVDVLPAYRKKGIASALTSRLAQEILQRGKVPFYCSAWSNIRSARNALKSGFVPAWVEMTIKPGRIVDEMNAQPR